MYLKGECQSWQCLISTYHPMGAPLQIYSSGAQGTIQKDPATLAQIHDMHEHERVGYAMRVCLKEGDGIRTDPKSKEGTSS